MWEGLGTRLLISNYSLVVGVPDELDDDVLIWLNLQHLQNQADEGCGLDVGPVDPAHVVQVHRSVHQQLGWVGIREIMFLVKSIAHAVLVS